MSPILTEDRADVLVIGAGPSGAVNARYLAERGFRVVCLEQGDWVNPTEFPGDKPEWEMLIRERWNADPNVRRGEADYPTEVSESDISPVMYSAVGGGSILYGAQWMRLLPSDFRVRTLDGVADDWPFTYDDLLPYYQRMDEAVGTAGLTGDPMYPATDVDYPLPPHPIGKIGRRAARGMNKLGWHWWPGPQAIASQRNGNLDPCARFGVCENGCPQGAKASFDLTHWPIALRAGAQLVTRARVSKIETDAKGRATGAVYFDKDGVERFQAADVVIVAANGVGTPRLLLNSANAQHPDGLGNSSGQVGRRLMLHPNAEVTGVYDEDMNSWVGPAGHSIISLEFYETDTSRGFLRGAKWQVMPTGGPLRALGLAAGDTFDERWGKAAHDQMRETFGRTLQWGFNCDDLPEETNAVTLDPTLTDSNGIPSPKINYRLSDNTRRMLRFHLDRLHEAHSAAGAIRTVETPLWHDQPGHLLGTARMGADPATSVVDQYGRSHDVPNLFIADGSVFPTGGGVNPTATITAVALRSVENMVEHARNQEVPA